MTLTLDKG